MERGYDVWKINFRGTLFSLSHKNPNITQEEFFNYTVHDYALKDIPTVVENILKITNKDKIILFGQSNGCNVITLGLSDESTYHFMNKNVERAIYTSPLTLPCFNKDEYHIKHPQSMEVLNDIIAKSKELGIYHLNHGALNTDEVEWRKITNYQIKKYNSGDVKKTGLIRTNMKVDGLMRREFLDEIIRFFLPMLKYFGHRGLVFLGQHGTSVRCSTSMGQLSAYYNHQPGNTKICQYDWGKEENLKRYGTEAPPEYNFKNVNIPIDMMVG